MSDPQQPAPYGPLELMLEVHGWLTQSTELQGESGLQVEPLEHAPDPDPPCVVVGPPSWTYHGVVGGPADYSLTVYVVVDIGSDSFAQLMRWAPTVTRILDEPPGLAVKGSRPTVFPGGSTDLPAYAIDIEVTA